MKRAVIVGLPLLVSVFLSRQGWPQTRSAQRSISVDPDGTVHIQNATVPPSKFLSDEAKRVLRRTKPTEGPGAPVPVPQLDDIAEVRRQYNEALQPNVGHMRDLYPVDVEETTIEGISVAVVTPKGGVPAKNKNRALINAPGGGFRTGVRGNGLLISIPVSSLGGFKVVTILYRQAPEYRFPAASEDLTKVYKTMLKDYKPENLGMFGCSAGGALIAQTVALFQQSGLPRPGVLGIYCSGAGADFGGDSAIFTSLVTPGAAPGTDTAPALGYLQGVDMNQPTVWPAGDPSVLAKFPPTIYLTATRDFAMSAAAYSYRRMIEAGVESALLIYDGLGHGFMTNPDIPESRDAYEITTKFYDKHLGH